MRLGMLDVGSNTVHLLVVDAHRGGQPTPMSSTKASLRLAEGIDSSGKLALEGADELVGATSVGQDRRQQRVCRVDGLRHLGGA